MNDQQIDIHWGVLEIMVMACLDMQWISENKVLNFYEDTVLDNKAWIFEDVSIWVFSYKFRLECMDFIDDIVPNG